MTNPRPIANRNQMPAANDGPNTSGVSIADQVQPFMLETSQLRGRMVRLNRTIDTIVQTHAYPESVAHLLAEALSMTALLAGMLKFDGIFTLQIKGDGPVTLLVCDLTTKGHLRGFANYDAAAVADLTETDKPALKAICGSGYLAFTVDQKKATDRYQGIVELTGDSLADAVRHYFHQSEQIKTGFEIAVGQSFVNDHAPHGHWHGAAIMLQQLAVTGGTLGDAFGDGDNAAVVDMESDVVIDNWRRAMLLLNTASAAEMLDPNLPVNDVLYRLFHEEGVRVFPPLPIVAKCRCSRKKIAPIIDPLPLAEKQELAENGVITVTCEFCNTPYLFPVEPPVPPSR